MVASRAAHVAGRTRTRREILKLAGGGAAALLLACGRASAARDVPASPEVDTRAVSAMFPLDDAAPPAEAVAPPRAVFPAGQTSRVLLPGTPWATPLVISHSGLPGPVVLILGGVHGNEPGAWIAAGEIATWTPRTGSLLVLPRANVLAVAAGERTLPGLGDLNRLYPGSASEKSPPMARMANAIVEAAREFHVQVLYDMHESWEFFVERAANGNAYLGQTVSAGAGPESATVARALVARANQRITGKRDRMLARSEVPPAGVKATNSLGVGLFVDGLTALLVEMGQERQDVDRRAALHLLVARTFLESRSML